MVSWPAHKILLRPNFSWCLPPYPFISFFVVLNSTITEEHKVKSSLSISPCHDQDLTASTAYTKDSIHRVQHTPSTAYTEYSIHRVQHTPSTAYTEYSIHSVQHTLSTAYTAYCIIHTSTVSRSQPVSHLSAHHVGLNSQHSHNYELTNEWNLRHRSASLPNYRLQIHHLLVLLQSRSIMAFKCISKLARSQPACVSPNLLDYSLQVSTIMAFKCICKLAWSRPPSASPNSLDYGLQFHLEPCSNLAAKCITKLARLQPPSVSPISLDYTLGVHPWVLLIMVWWNGGGRRQTAHHQHSAAPCMVSEGN